MFTHKALLAAWTCAKDPQDREHVTPYIIRNNRRVNLASGRFDLAQHRWTLDWEEDLEFMNAVADFGPITSMEAILATLDNYPYLKSINAARRAA